MKIDTQKNKMIFKKNVVAWLIMLPSLILFGFFVWLPLIENVQLSMYTTQGVKLVDFVGLENYRQVLQHPNFQKAFFNTFVYIFWSLVLGFWIPIFIASLVSEAFCMKSFFKVSVYFPNILPGLASVMLWGYFFRPGDTGVLNILLGKIGLQPFDWLIVPGFTIPLIVLTMTWKAAGSTALIYMAGMSGIPVELYEAATIDGANPFKRFVHIVLPSILNLGKTLLILQVIAVFQILYEPLVMTNGGPNNASISIMQLVYKYAFEDYNYSMAAALSVMISIVLIILTGVYFYVSKNSNE